MRPSPSVLLLLLFAVTGCSKACNRLAGAEESDGCAHCTKDEYCSSENRCVPRGKLGGTCEQAEHCIDDHAYCKDHRCTAYSKIGEACDSATACASPAVCRAGKCAPPPKLGEACELPSECADEGALCKNAKCTARPKAGEPCDEDSECFAGAYCSADKKCTAFAPKGAPCKIVRCAEGLYCVPDGDKSTCVEPLGEGERCQDAGPCRKGLACTEGVCRAPTGGGSGFSRPHPF